MSDWPMVPHPVNCDCLIHAAVQPAFVAAMAEWMDEHEPEWHGTCGLLRVHGPHDGCGGYRGDTVYVVGGPSVIK